MAPNLKEPNFAGELLPAGCHEAPVDPLHMTLSTVVQRIKGWSSCKILMEFPMKT